LLLFKMRIAVNLQEQVKKIRNKESKATISLFPILYELDKFIYLFPLNCARWFGGNVINHTVYTLHFINNTIRNNLE